MSLIAFNWFINQTHSKLDVWFCSITKPNQTLVVRLGLIEFWFDFVRLDMPGLFALLPFGAVISALGHGKLLL